MRQVSQGGSWRGNHISVTDTGSRSANQGVKEDWVTGFIWTRRNLWDKVPDKGC